MKASIQSYHWQVSKLERLFFHSFCLAKDTSKSAPSDLHFHLRPQNSFSSSDARYAESTRKTMSR